MKLSYNVRRRLESLANLLDKVPRSQFDYNHWSTGEKDKEHPCGTSACALGWATQLQYAKRVAKVKLAPWGNAFLTENGYEISAREAAFRIFDGELSSSGDYDDTFSKLFHPRDGESNATAKQVARKIRRFVRDNS